MIGTDLPPFLEIRGLRKTYSAPGQDSIVAIDNMSLSIDKGTTTAITGPSGCGKSTLLGCIGCMMRPTAGRILLEGREITSLSERFLAIQRRRTFGFLFENPSLIDALTVLENVMVPRYPEGDRFTSLRNRAMELLDLFGISDRAQRMPRELSGGEAQRAALARALINNPSALIADEPTTHLDSENAAVFLELTRTIRSRGTTIIIASHDAAVYETDFVDRVVGLRDGRLSSDHSRATRIHNCRRRSGEGG